MKQLSEKMMSEQASQAERIRSDVEFDQLVRDRNDRKSPLMGELHVEETVPPSISGP